MKQIYSMREAEWARYASQVDRIGIGNRSRMGGSVDIPLDPGVKELVTGLNAHGLPTTMSCEGHVGSGGLVLRTPFVLVGENLQTGLPTDVTKERNRAALSKVNGLLDDFYGQGGPEERLVALPFGYSSADIVILQNRGYFGARKREYATKEAVVERLGRDQREVTEFGSFLKRKFIGI